MNGKIVYNRKYGDIPKGSYTGGSTYTVKRGDTLFYIAWVTGNDFRDLAQRNNIPAPYGLNVGQTLRLVTRPVSQSPEITCRPGQREGQQWRDVNRKFCTKNPPRWLRPNQLLRILNLQVNRVLIRCCRITSLATTTTTVALPGPGCQHNPIDCSSTSTSSPISSWRWAD